MEKIKNENSNKIYDIMGCRLSKSGKGYNVVLVHNDVDNTKKYANLFIKKDRARSVVTDEGRKGITIFISLFNDKDEKVTAPTTDEMPF